MALTRDLFRAEAKDIPLKIGDQTMIAEPKEFSTGSLGWYAGGKTTVKLNGEVVKVQVGINLDVSDLAFARRLFSIVIPDDEGVAHVMITAEHHRKRATSDNALHSRAN